MQNFSRWLYCAFVNVLIAVLKKMPHKKVLLVFSYLLFRFCFFACYLFHCIARVRAESTFNTMNGKLTVGFRYVSDHDFGRLLLFFFFSIYTFYFQLVSKFSFEKLELLVADRVIILILNTLRWTAHISIAFLVALPFSLVFLNTKHV